MTDPRIRTIRRDDFGQPDVDKDVLAWFYPASMKAVQVVLSRLENHPDGRSEWLWLRLPNGDLMLGVFPHGSTYFANEKEYLI